MFSRGSTREPKKGTGEKLLTGYKMAWEQGFFLSSHKTHVLVLSLELVVAAAPKLNHHCGHFLSSSACQAPPDFSKILTPSPEIAPHDSSSTCFNFSKIKETPPFLSMEIAKGGSYIYKL